jgi:antitoxin component of MazEF toxin-antitoxin module
MIQKVLKVGSSAAVTIPKKSLKELGISIGSDVIVDADAVNGVLSVRSVKARTNERDKITALALDFVNRYRKDLEALANE